MLGWLGVQWRQLRWPLIGLAGFGVLLLIIWALVVIPAQVLDVDQVQEVQRIQDPARRLDEVNGLRSNLATVFAGLAVAAGVVLAALTFQETSRQNRVVLELQRRGQVMERFSRAIEQLGQRGEEKLDVRIGAVYALEQIARESADLRWPIMEALTAYLRWNASTRAAAERDGDAQRLPPDHQAIAAVIGRRRPAQDEVDQLDLHETDLVGADLPRADLRRANLQEANLVRINLTGADLRDANLVNANLRGADLSGAGLGGANLSAADLIGAGLANADLIGAGLFGADLRAADLGSAELVNANLRRANLRGANLRGADLSQADLTQADLSQADMRGAIGLGPEQLAAAERIAGVLLDPPIAQMVLGPTTIRPRHVRQIRGYDPLANRDAPDRATTGAGP